MINKENKDTTTIDNAFDQSSLLLTNTNVVWYLIGWATLGGLATYLNKVAALYMWRKADQMGVNSASLFDVFHSLIDEYFPSLIFLQDHVLWLPDMFATFSISLFVITLSSKNRLFILNEFLRLLSITLLLRLTTILATLMPTSVKPCLGPELPRVESLNHITSIWLPQGLMFCNDQMFSGHTTINTLCVGFFLCFIKVPLVRVLCVIYLTCALVITILTHDHYTADVLVALYISILMLISSKERLSTLFRESNST